MMCENHTTFQGLLHHTLPVYRVKGGDGAIVAPDYVEGAFVLSHGLPPYSGWKWVGCKKYKASLKGLF